LLHRIACEFQKLATARDAQLLVILARLHTGLFHETTQEGAFTEMGVVCKQSDGEGRGHIRLRRVGRGWLIALCPDLFWRQERGVDLSVRSKPDWHKGLSLYKAFDLDLGVRDVAATVVAARTAFGKSVPVGVMGFFLGGLLTYLTAARTEVDAAVAFHGSRTEEFLDESADVDGPLQMHLAEEDEFIPKDVQGRISAALAGNPHVEIHSCPGCRHAFSRHDGLHFDPDAARLSRARTLEFFRRHLA
jgi:carboxymethylenebutenolidase